MKGYHISLKVWLTLSILVQPFSCAHITYNTATEEVEDPDSELSIIIPNDNSTVDNGNSSENITIEIQNYERDRFVDNNVTEIVLDHFLVSSAILKAIESSTSDDTEKLRFFQEEEFKENEIYQEAWIRGRAILEEKRQDPTLTAVNETEGIPDEYHIALITYSLAFPALYHDFNAKTRTIKNITEVDSYKWKSYFKFLLLGMMRVKGHPREKPDVLFRGVAGWFKMDLGEKVMFQHFVSTSTESNIAKYFSSTEASTLFEIRGRVSKSIGLDHHSVFAEKEWVLAPRQLYSVENVTDHVDRYKGKVRMVILESIGDKELEMYSGNAGTSYDNAKLFHVLIGLSFAKFIFTNC